LSEREKSINRRVRTHSTFSRRSIAHQATKVGIELVDALRLLVQSDFDPLQEPYELIDLPAQVLVLHTSDIHAAAGKVLGGVAAIRGGTTVMAAVTG
jgi:hypothetical protein